MAYLSWRNKIKKRPGERAKMLEKYVAASNEKADDDDGDNDGGLTIWMELGDQHPDFVYTL